MSQITGWFDELAYGALVIGAVFLTSGIMTIAFGILGAAARLTGGWFGRLASAYVLFFRGTPELLILFLVYYGSAITLTALARWIDPASGFVDLAPFWAGSFALALIAGAYATETFRGAFLAVGSGQMDAARALGLGPVQAFLLVRFPQVWRIALPGLGNHAISLVKDTALLSIIGLNEIMFTAKQAISLTNMPFAFYALVGIIYLVFTTILTELVRRAEVGANRHLVR